MQHVRLIHAALMRLLWSETDAGSTQAKRMAEATPDPWPAGAGGSRSWVCWR